MGALEYAMITLYTFATPNGHKASILFEELGLAYRARSVSLIRGEHKTPEFLKISPLGRIPAAVETLADGREARLFGSGAIMLHYALREGRLLPDNPEQRLESLNWFEMAISDLGPAAVNLFRFTVRAPEKLPYAIEMFSSEVKRCYEAIEARLGQTEYLAGTSYSIADIACFPFVAASAVAHPGWLDGLINLKRWHDALAARPAVARGMAVP
ncbi:glutathione S-transferase [uncultured Gammaproteobacteria bacterium]